MGQIGFMQGRLSPMIEAKIQAFPWPYWREEFALAEALDLACMEWTIDHARLAENPLMSVSGRQAILNLSQIHNIAIPSLTGDCFMQAPFWKAESATRRSLLQEFSAVAEACAALGIRIIVVPLVDHGSLQEPQHVAALAEGLDGITEKLRALRLTVAFESDFPPEKLASFIEHYPDDCFGINYDIGNSASLGWNPHEEIQLLQQRIVNVHVKDRLAGGTTVPLGKGAADFRLIFGLLKSAGYKGNYILQTARAMDGDHTGAIGLYRNMVEDFLSS